MPADSSHDSVPVQVARLLRRLTVYKIFVFILALAVTLLAFALQRTGKHTDDRFWQEDSRSAQPPHYQTIMKMLNRLEYSRIPALRRSDVSLAVDFENRRWSLKNIYHYDQAGDILLEHSRYGICSELTAYVYKQIKPLFDEQEYKIQYAQVNETRFYMKPDSVHVVLLITKLHPKKESFILDPSFKEYGRREVMGHYYLRQTFDNLPLLVRRLRDQEAKAGAGRIIFAANQDSLLSFAVEPVFDKFDRQHFALVLTATRQHWYVGRYVFAVVMTPDGRETIENALLAKRILTRKDFEFLKQKISEWFEQIVRQD